MHKHFDSVTTLPPIILNYFATPNEGHIEEVTACFTENAHVRDEDLDHLGHAAIRAWVATTTESAKPQTELLRAIESDGTLIATAKVSGNFPGSPVELKFSFTFADEKISKPSIQ